MADRELTPTEVAVRGAVYGGLARTGSAPTPAELAQDLQLSPASVAEALAALHAEQLLVLGPGGDAVRMAHPFSTAPMGFVLRAPDDDRMWWGGCAWDSFGITAALAEELLVSTRCPGCWQALELPIGPGRPPAEPYAVVVPLPAGRWWDDVVWTCTRIRLCCDAEHAAEAISRGRLTGAETVPARTLWALSLTWYADRLDPDYRPQSRDSRQAQLVEVGLTGPFWELP